MIQRLSVYAVLIALLCVSQVTGLKSLPVCSEEDHPVYQYYTTRLVLSKVPKTQNGTRLQIAVTSGHCPRDCTTSRQTIEAPVKELVDLPLNSITGSIGDTYAGSVPITIRLSEVPPGKLDTDDENTRSDVVSWQVTAPYFESIGDNITCTLDFGGDGKNPMAGPDCRVSRPDEVVLYSTGYQGKATLLIERVASLGQTPGPTEAGGSTSGANVSSATTTLQTNSSPLAAATEATGDQATRAAVVQNSSGDAWYWYEAAVAMQPQKQGTFNTFTPQEGHSKRVGVGLLLNGQPLASTSGDGSTSGGFAAGTAQRGVQATNTTATAKALTLRLYEEDEQGNRQHIFLEKAVPVPVLAKLCDFRAFEFPFDSKQADPACKGNSSCTGVRGTAVVQVMRIVPPAVLPPELPPAFPTSPSPSTSQAPMEIPGSSARRAESPLHIVSMLSVSVLLVFLL